MSVIEFLAFGIVIVTLLVGVAAVVSLAVGHVQEILRTRRGMVTEVRCPRDEQPTVVRIGIPEGEMRLRVLWCERQPEGSPRCEMKCFPLLHTLRPRRPEAMAS
jgi:hypothetical protein